MGIKVIGGKPYCYQTYRVGREVRSRYIGPGWMAPMIAQDEAERKAAKAEARRVAEEQGRAMAEWFRRTGQVIDLCLIAAGCYRRKRQWRRPRNMDTTPAIEMEANPQAPAKAELSPESRAVLARVEAGDKSITAVEAHRLLREKPDLIDPSMVPHAVVFNLANRVYKDDEYRRRLLIAQCNSVRDDLAGPSPTPIERLLAERAAACWMEVNILEVGAAFSGKATSLSIRQIESANRRFLAAVGTLARVRKLALPDVKVTFDGRAVYIDGRRFGVAPDSAPPAQLVG